MEVNSRYAESCLAWLGAIDVVLSKQPLLDRFGRSLDDAGLRIALQVEPFDVSQSRDLAAQEQRERDNLLLSRVGEPDAERRIYAHRGTSEDEAARDNRPKAELLDPLLDTLEVGMILGDPGSGKSESLKGLAVRVARERFSALDNHRLLPDDICLPVFAELPKVAELFGRDDSIPERLHTFAIRWLDVKPQDDQARLLAAILCAALQLLRLDTDAGLAKYAAAVRKIWRDWQTKPEPGKPRDAGAVLLLDAWDEVAEQDRTTRFKSALNHLSIQPPARLFASSRIVGFEPGVLAVPATSGSRAPRRELAVRPFRFEDCEAFIRAFLPQRDSAGKLIGDLRTKPMIMGMLQNPLLATLICLAFDPSAPKPLPMPARRAAVYEAVVRRLLGDEEALRKARPVLRGDLIPEIISVFRALAFELWPNELFQEKRLDTFCAGSRCPRIPALRNFLSETNQTLIHFLRHCGMLASHGENGLRFLHLTFQEFFVGGHLAAAVDNGWSRAVIDVRSQDGQWRETNVRTFVARKAWDPRWREAIILFAGQIESVPVEPLLETLLAGEDDVLHHRLCLAAACLPELTGGALKNSARIAAAIAIQVWNLWREFASQEQNLWWDNEGLRLDHPKAIACVASVTLSPSDAAQTLLHRIAYLFGGQKEDRVLALNTVKTIGTAAAKDPVLAELAHYVRHYTGIGYELESLEYLGGAAATAEMVDAFAYRIQNVELDASTIGAIGALGLGLMKRPDVQDALARGLEMGNAANDWSVSFRTLRILGYYTWGRLPSKLFRGIVRSIENMDTSRSLYTVSELIEAKLYGLFKPHLANEEILEEISRLISNDSWEVRKLAVALLRGLKEGAAQGVMLDRLQAQFHHVDPDLVRSALEAVAAIGPGAATPAICTSLRSVFDRQDDLLTTETIKSLAAIDAITKPECLSAVTDLLEDTEGVGHWTDFSRWTYVGDQAARAISDLDLAAIDGGVVQKVSTLLDHPRTVVQSRAALALSGTGSVEIGGDRLDRIIRLIGDGGTSIDEGAKAFLQSCVRNNKHREHILEELTKRLDQPSENTRKMTANFLRDLGPAAREPGVIEALSRSLNDQSIAGHALRALAEIGPPSLTEDTRTACKRVFANPAFNGLKEDVEALVKLGINDVPQRFLTDLLQRLRKSDEEIREDAFKCIEVLPRQETARTDFLEEICKIITTPIHYPGYEVGIDEHNPNRDIPRRALRILSWFADYVPAHPSITDAIAQLLASSEPAMRERGASAVWEIGANAATNGVLDALADVISNRNSPLWDPKAVKVALVGLKGAAQPSTKLLDAIADQLAATATPEKEFIEMAKSLPSVRFFVVRDESWLPLFGRPRTRGKWEYVDNLAG